MNDVVPREEVSRRGVNAVLGVAGGVGLIVVNAVLTLPIIGAVIGGAIALAGISGLKSRGARTAAVVATVAGSMAVLNQFHILSNLTHTVVGLGIFGLLAFGAWNAWKFVQGLKSRS